MKTLRKRALSLVLTVCMILSLLPAVVPTARAAETNISGVGVNGTLVNGTTYLVTEDTSRVATGAGQNGLQVASGATVTIDFGTSNATLTVKGANASGRTAAGAGIYLPSGATLIVKGKGAIVATGGNAASGDSGGTGTSGWIEYSRMWGGDGGSGGSGGAGAGAGIGGNGGAAGSGGSGGQYGSAVATELNQGTRSGKNGTSGYSGSPGNAGGVLRVLGNVTVTATGGNGGSNGSGGNAGNSYKNEDFGYYWNNFYTATAGAGGGGGGGGGKAASIGGGGTGGGGGGGGASGGTYTNQKQNGRGWLHGGGGGGGGGPAYGYGGTCSGSDGGATSGGSGSGTGSMYGGSRGNRGGYGSYVGGYGGTGGNGGGNGGGGSTVYTTKPISVSGGTQANGQGVASTVYVAYPVEECSVEFTTAGIGGGAGSYAYTGGEIKPGIKVTHTPTGTILPAGSYSVSYSANTAPGTATATISGVGFSTSRPTLMGTTYNGTGTIANKTFSIKVNMDECTATLNSPISGTGNIYAWTGSQVKPTVTVKHSTGLTVNTAYYTLGYENNLNASMSEGVPTATVTVTPGTNMYGAAKTLSFVISKVPVITAQNTATYYDAYLNNAYTLNLGGEGTSPITYALVSGSLPTGLTLNASSGVISGTPTKAGTYTATVTASNKAGTSSKAFTWQVGGLLGRMWVDANKNGKYDAGEDAVGAQIDVYQQDTDKLLATAKTDAYGNYGFMNLGAYAKVDISITPNNPSVHRLTATGTAVGTAGTAATGTRIMGVPTGGSAGMGLLNGAFVRAVTVTLNVGAGTLETGTPTTYQIFPGDKLVLPVATPNVSGSRFAGWFTASTGGVEFDGQAPETNTTYYAQYDEKGYTVKYDTDGGSAIGSLPVGFTAANLIPAVKPTRLGYVFQKWVVYGNESYPLTAASTYSEVVDGDYRVASITLKAIWQRRSDITVTLDANGSTSLPATINGQPKQVLENLTYQELLEYDAPERAGYSFKGWSEKKTYTAGVDKKPTMSLTVPGDHTTYYAIWQAVDIGVSFDGMGGAFPEGEDGARTGKPGAAYTLPSNPLREGYTFQGWFTTPTGSVLAYNKAETEGSIPTGTTYYYAQWKPNRVTLILEAENAAPDQQKIEGNYGDTVRYDLPVKKDAAFTGWKVDGKAQMFITFPAKSTSYTAEFAEGKIALAYNAMGGSFKAGENGLRQGNPGAAYTPPEDPAKPGYTFGGWYTTLELVTPAPAEFKIPSLSATYYAKWVPNQVTLTLTAADATPPTQTSTGDYGATITYTTPTKSGAAFIGWKLAGAEDATAAMYPTYPVRDGAMEAVFSTSVVSVVYLAMGGEFQTGDGQYQGAPGASYTPPTTPDYPGFKFLGWFTDPIAGAEYKGNTFPAEKNTIYYAHWQAEQITVLLDAGNDGSPKQQSKTGSAGELIDYTQVVRDGYSFMGWKTKDALDSAAVKSPRYTAGVTELQAVWRENSISVTYDPMGGAITAGDSTFVGVPGLEYIVPVVKRPGYTFTGWYTKPIGGVEVTASGTVQLPAANATYYAHWEAKAVLATMNAGTGATPEKQEKQGIYGKAIEYTIPTMADSAFVGWKVDGADDGTRTMFPTYPETTTTYTAVWAQGKVSVAFSPQGGVFQDGVNSVLTGDPGMAYVLPANPTRIGYEFAGWYTQPNGGGAVHTDGKFPNETNTFYYAKWNANAVTVTLDHNDNGATQDETKTGAYGDIIRFVQPTRVGHVFQGWSTEQAASVGDFYPTFPQTDGVRLYAIWSAEKVTVVFDPFGGSFSGSESGIYKGVVGTPLAVPLDPAQPGYKFKGWYTAPMGGTLLTQTVFPASGKTYYARWELASTDMTLNENFGDSPKVTTTTGAAGSVVVYEIPAREGYTFQGWGLAADAPTGDKFPTYPLSGTETRYAVWAGKTIRVAFETMGGTLADGAPGSHSGRPGETYSLPAADRTGFAFEGWHTSPTGGDKVTVGVVPTADVTYYAQWSPEEITIYLSPNGGAFNGDTNPLELTGGYGTAVNYTLPVRDGYQFGGWKIKGGQDADAVLQLSYPSVGLSEYEAVWVPAGSVQVLYDPMGGVLTGQASYIGKTGDAWTAPGVTAREGYRFGGWLAAPDDTTADHQDGALKRYGTAPQTTYYAKWTAETIQVTLHWGNGSPQNTVAGPFGDVIPYQQPAWPGYAFKGWSETEGDNTGKLALTFTAALSGKDLYAVWVAETQTVTFYPMGGTGGGDLTGKTGEAYAVPADPVRTGYTFTGWYTAMSGGTKLEKAAGDTLTYSAGAPGSYYAQWTLTDIHLKWHQNDGGADTPSETTETYGKALLQTPAARPGYSFLGWNVDKSALTGSLSISCPAVDTEYYAIWKLNSVSVRYDPMEGTLAGATEFDGDVTKTYTVPQDPTREGYTFDGWFTETSGGVQIRPDGTYPPENVTYYARWHVNTVTITLNAENGVPATQTQSGSYGALVNYTIPTRKGHTFAGWQKSGESTAQAFLLFPSEDAVYDAMFTAGDITVAYNSAGGKFQAGETGVRTGTPETGYTIPTDPTREGYDFTGWYTTLIGSVEAPKDGKFPDVNTNYYAQWRLKEITVTLDANGGTGGEAAAQGAYGSAITYTIPVLADHAFIGWKTQAADDASATMFPVFTADVTLYAVWKANGASVAFFALGGTGNASYTGVVGETYTVPADPSRSGYSFAEWNTAPDGTGDKLAVAAGGTAPYVRSPNVSYYAQWKAAETSVTLKDGSNVLETLRGPYGTAVNYSAPVKNGYAFLGWKLQNEVDDAARISLTYPAAATVYYAVWKLADVTLTLELQGGESGGSTGTLTRQGAAGERYTAPADPVRTGYTFEGWYSQRDGGTRQTLGVFPATSRSYYAHWTLKTVTVTLDVAGGSGSEASVSGKYGARIVYTKPARVSYTFLGWKVAGTNDNTAIMFPTFPAEDGQTLEAVWKVGTEIVVTYDPQGGSFTAGENGVYSGTAGDAYAKPADPGYSGYLFGGWYTGKNGTGTAHPADSPTIPAADLTYYAHWTTTTVTVTLNENYGDAPVIDTVSGNFGAAIPYTVPTRPGYTFLGWSLDRGAQTGETLVYFTTQVNNQTLYAIWGAGAVTMTYQPMGGTFAAPEDGVRAGQAGDAMTPPADPTRTGYQFLGWFTKAAGGERAPSHTALPVSNTTYYAQWQINHVTVSLDLNYAGTTPVSQQGDYGTLLSYEMPVRPGYGFLGWSTDKTAGRGERYLTYPAANQTYYAVWDANSITVTFDPMGGDIADNVQVGTPGEALTTPADPTRNGYIFAGWFTHPVSNIGATIPTVFPSADVTYYAHWTAAQVTVTLLGGEGSTEHTRQELTGDAGTAVSYQIPVRPGYIFDGWSDNGLDAQLYLTYPNTDTEYTAVWQDTGDVRVLYYPMGGSLTATGDLSGKPGAGYTAPETMPWEAYTFDGWSTEPSGGAIDHAGGTEQTYPAAAFTAYYAQWTPVSVSVTLDAGNGDEAVDKSGAIGAVITYTMPTRPGYTFKGWSVDSTAVSGDIFPSFTKALSGETLHGIWEAEKVSVSFFAEPGSTVHTGRADETYEVPADPIRPGYAFDGWYMDTEDETTRLAAASGEEEPYPEAANTNYYAKWTREDVTVTLTDDGAGTPYTGHYGDVVVYTMPSRPGYTFLGWNTDSAADVGEVFLTYPEGAETYHAIWQVRTVTVTFEAMGGTLVGDTNHTGAVGDSYTVPDDPQRTGYTFLGWAKSPYDSANLVTLDGAIPTESVTYYAQWSATAVQVTLHLEGGTVNGVGDDIIKSGTYGAPVEYAVPVKAGVQFRGWATTSGASAGKLTLSFGEQDAEYYAVWGKGESYSVQFNLMGGTLAWTDEGKTEPVPNPYADPILADSATGTITIPALPEGVELRREKRSFGGFTDGKKTYQPGEEYTLPGYSVSLAAIWEGGGSDVSELAAVVFYDWDETTILGSIVVAKNDPEAAAAQIEAYTQSLYPAGYDPANGLDGTLYNANSPLTNKHGYSFGKWISMDAKDANGEKVYAIYGKTVSVTNSADIVDIPEPDAPDLTNLSEGLTLKAAFRPNVDMTQAADYQGREYTVSWVSYNRHLSADSYSIKVRIQREKSDVPVQRLRDAALRVTMNNNGTQVNTLVALTNVDDQVVEIAVPGTVQIVEARAIDIGGISNWVNGTAERSNIYSAQAGSTESQSGFVFEGNMAYINDVLATADGTLAATHYTVAGLTVSKGNVHGTSSTGASALRAQALINLRIAYQAKNANGTHVGLTWDEMASAIKFGTTPAPIEE